MKRELILIHSVPCDKYYQWQTHLWLESLRKIGKSHQAISLVFTPTFRPKTEGWDYIMETYPESKFFFVKDEDNISKILNIYLSISRPYMLMKYFKLHPELKDKAIFYCDADILFTDKFNIDKYLDDDVNYVSNTLSYINASYFDSKTKDVKPSKLEEYKAKDVLNEACSLVGVSRGIAEKNNLHSGGAQYLLKNIDWTFWDKMISDTLNIRVYLQNINREFFDSEDKGIQSWCADMWALLWGLWWKNQEVKIVPEMEFAWSSDPISKMENIGILHNAGIVSETQGDIPVFYKGKYHAGLNPFKDPYLDVLYNNEKTKNLCNWEYVKALIELRDKYKL